MKRDSIRERLNETEEGYRNLQAALLALDIASIQDRYVLAKEVHADLQQRRAELKAVFGKLPGLLAPRLVGLPLRQIEGVLDHAIRAAMIEVARLSAANGQRHVHTPSPGEGPQPKETR